MNSTDSKSRRTGHPAPRRFGRRGSTLAELLITCALFSVFMVISTGMFADMTRVVRREQTPAEQLLAGRLASLKVCRRVRNCKGLITPSIKTFLSEPTESMMLRDRVAGKTVDYRVVNGQLTETLYPLDYDPTKPQNFKPTKRRTLGQARALKITSGGYAHPTRVSVEVTLPDDRVVRCVTNFREAI